MDILIARRLVRAPAFTGALLALVAATACRGVEEEEIPKPPSLVTPEAAATSSPAPSPSPSPAPAPANLPPPAEGYTWYVRPVSNFGLPRYAVQVPVEWAPLNPGDSNPQDFAPPGLENILLGPSLTTVTTIADTAYAPAFRFELPSQGGQLCGILVNGQLQSASYSWNLFTFKCPADSFSACDVDHALDLIVCKSSDGKPAATTIEGRAAEVRVGEFVFSILVFQPVGSSVADAAFEQALASFVAQ